MPYKLCEMSIFVQRFFMNSHHGIHLESNLSLNGIANETCTVRLKGMIEVEAVS